MPLGPSVVTRRGGLHRTNPQGRGGSGLAAEDLCTHRVARRCGRGIADVLHQSAAASIDSQLRATKVILELGISRPWCSRGTAAYAVMIALRAATTGHHLSRADASADNVGSWVYIFMAIIVGFVLTQLLRRLHATELELVKRNEEAAALNDALHESNERREYEIQMKSKEVERLLAPRRRDACRLEEWHCAQELVLGQEDENAMSESYSHHTARWMASSRSKIQSARAHRVAATATRAGLKVNEVCCPGRRLGAGQREGRRVERPTVDGRATYSRRTVLALRLSGSTQRVLSVTRPVALTNMH